MQLTERGKVILLELVKSYKIKGSDKFMPDKSVLMTSAGLIDKDLDNRIKVDVGADLNMVSDLFNFARYKEDHPALTGLRKAMSDVRFKELYPFADKLKLNPYKSLPVSEADEEKFAKNREKLKNFDWRKK